MSEQAIVLVGMSVREVDARERLLGLAAPHGATRHSSNWEIPRCRAN